MRRPLLAVSLAMALLARPPIQADNLLFDRFGAYLDALRTQAGIPGLAAAIVGPKEILWEQAFGQQNLERSIATRIDTPFHLEGLTQIFTASLVLRCVEEGRVSLDDRIGRFAPDSPEPNTSIRQILNHTSGPADRLAFAYRPARLEALAPVVKACTGDSFRETVANQLERLAMIDSVPGPDSIRLTPPAAGMPLPDALARYTRVLERLATPYAVNDQGRAVPSQYAATTLTPASGIISTVRDLAQFDLALTAGVLLRPETLALASRAPTDHDGKPLPHGLGWFVQTYKGETIVWQFGIGDNASSSSLMIRVPARGRTLILLANSGGMVRLFAPAAGDVTATPFGRLFLGFVVR
jgi:CubicO group peptidase (beta-lactamase class C family)